jgi:hypothetical protein
MTGSPQRKRLFTRIFSELRFKFCLDYFSQYF